MGSASNTHKSAKDAKQINFEKDLDGKFKSMANETEK